MATSCGECGGDTTWDDQVCTAICTTCGTLVDPSQSVLTPQLYQSETCQFNQLGNPSSANTLKSFRTGSNWDLAGQGKEARDRRNTYAMHEFIKSLASTLSAPGITLRATNLFTQAMATGTFRWGRKAKLVAGACIAVALRESRRPDSLCDIAFLLDETPLLLTRTFSNVTSLLNLALTSADPACHISILQSHLSSLLQSPQPDSELPVSLLSLLKPLSMLSVTHTASSLTDLLARLGEATPLARLPTPPTACALLLLAYEAEARTSISYLSDLAQYLGVRCHVGKGVVMSRYKMIQDIVAEWIKEVPWLDQYQCKEGRAKIAKRLVVARGLKDVLQFQEEIWRKKLEANDLPRVALEVDDDHDDHDESSDSSDVSSKLTPHVATTMPNNEPGHEMSLALHRHKKRKTQQSLQQATQFLLNPLTGPLPLFYRSTPGCGPVPPQKTPSCSSTTTSSSNSLIPTPLAPAITTSTVNHLPLTSYLLADSSSNTQKLPTRLQLLAAARGGAGPKEVDDDELFEEGEWKSILRSEEECQKLKDLWEWADGDGAVNDAEERQRMDGDRGSRKMRHEWKQVGSKKVNMEALTKFLNATGDIDGADAFGLDEFDYQDQGVNREVNREDQDDRLRASGRQFPLVSRSESSHHIQTG